MTIFNPLYAALAAMGFTDPIHPPLTHVPIGLVVAALIFGLTGWLLRRPAWSQAARYCLGLAWLFIFPTVLLGFMDWQHYYQGAWLLPIIVKIGLASFLFVLLSIGLILVKTGREESKALLAIYLIAFFIMQGLGVLRRTPGVWRQGSGHAARPFRPGKGCSKTTAWPVTRTAATPSRPRQLLSNPMS